VNVHPNIVTFDTGAHNSLADDPLSEQLIAKIHSGMFFRFAGLSIEELYATKDQVRRKHLLASCRKLQQEPTDCLYPPSELLRLLIQGHAGNTTGSFDWTKVEVGSLAEIEDRFEDQGGGNDWDNMGHQKVIYEVIGDLFDALGILGSGNAGNRELGRSRNAFIA